MYRLCVYLSSTQRTAPQVHFLAVVGTEMEIRPLQLTTTQLQWTMNMLLVSLQTFQLPIAESGFIKPLPCGVNKGF